MPAPEPCSILDRLFSCDTLMETDFSKVLASSESSASLAFSASPGLTPWQLREWKPSNHSRDADHKEEPKASSWDWDVWQLSLSPLVQAFLSPNIDPGLDPTLSATLSESTEETETEKPTLEPESSSFDMSALSNSLGISPHSKLHSKFQSKLHSRTHSKFQATFQAIMEESEPESESESESEPRPLQKSDWISSSTMSTMDSLFGASASSGSETNWDPPKCSSKLWDTSKSHLQLWGPCD